jgi:hypothetical protein
VIALLVNPSNASTERIMGDVQAAARAKGVQLHILKASSESGIDGLSPPLSNCKPERSLSVPIHFS